MTGQSQTHFVYYDEGGKIHNVMDTYHPGLKDLQVIVVPQKESPFNLNRFTVTDSILTKNRNLPLHELKIAMISVYGINCGIATYTKYICDEIKPQVKELRIFAEVVDHPKEFKAEDIRNNIVRCWDRSKDYSTIIPEMEKYDPDVIFIQHEYGSFRDGVKWNILLGGLSKWRTIVVLHSVYNHDSKLIFEAPCNEIIVHSQGCKDLLLKKGYEYKKIHLIPHGCIPATSSPYKFSTVEGQKVIFQFGFGFDYKGWSTVIDIMDILRHEVENVRYIGVFNISKFTEASQNRYYETLITEIKRRNLEGHMTLIKGYQPEETIFSYLYQASVGLFPYWNHHEWRVEGASGAIRLALACKIPIVVGDVPFFNEFKNYLPICSNVDEYVETLKKLLNSEDERNVVKDRIKKFVDARTWEKTGKWYLKTIYQDVNALEEINQENPGGT